MDQRSPNLPTLAYALLSVLGLLGLSTFANSASAQEAAGSAGRALDANPQQGSSGVNRPEGVIDFRARNNIVTGNVTDFRQFRGDVGYSAPGEFGERLGSDDLFRFRADSFSSGRTQLNAASINRDKSNLSLNVYSTVSQIPGFSYRQSPMSNRNFASEGGGFQLFNPVFRPPSATGLITEPIAGDIRDTGTSMGLIEVPDGRTLEVTASPLLGLQRSALPEFTITPFDREQRRRDRAERREDRFRELDFGLLSRLDTRVEGDVTDPELQRQGPFTDRPGRVEPTLLIGRAIQSRITARRGDVPADQTLEDRVERIEQRIFSPLGNRNVEPGEDVYLDLLRQMRQRDQPRDPDRPEPSDRLTGPQREQPPAEEEDQAMDEDDPFDPDALDPLRRGLEDALDEPQEQQLREAIEEARRARRSQLGLDTGEDEADADDRDDGLLDADDPVSEMLRRMRDRDAAEDPDAEAEERAQALGELLDTLSRETPMLDTLAGQRETRRNQLLAEAEAELAEGRYFAAEQIYRQLVRGGDEEGPLARVGLVHAQLAAGMIRSAGLNLRRLFENHPELIGVRYEANLLPPPERIEKIQQELQRSINRDVADADPGLLLAYLGFQAGSERVVRYGLSVAEADSPRDPLIPVLRGVWLGRLDTGAADGDAAPTGDADTDADAEQPGPDASTRPAVEDPSSEPAGK